MVSLVVMNDLTLRKYILKFSVIKTMSATYCQMVQEKTTCIIKNDEPDVTKNS